MSGRQEKTNRRERGISVFARREQAAFGRIVEHTREIRAAARALRRQRRRTRYAVSALIVFAVLLCAAVAGAFT